MRNWRGPAVSGTEDGIDFDARYTVTGMPGVAFWLHGWAQRETPEAWDLVCEITDYGHDHDDTCYLYSEPETVPDTSMVRAIMVGDDYVHFIDRDDLTVISEDDYCHECGQTGCGHGRPS